MIIQGQVGVPNTAQTGNPYTPAGRQGEVLFAELHGKWWNALMVGKAFAGMALIAGVTIPVNTATAATFTLFNPLGSGVNVELISLDIGWPAAATTVVATILGSISTQTPTSVTAGGSTVALPVGGGGVAQAKLYTVATITAITTHIPLFQITSTADAEVSSHYDFDGSVGLAPGGLITLTSTPVQTGVALPCFRWAEWS